MLYNSSILKNCRRWEIYTFFKENKDKYNIILETDVRDTIFQKEIFQLYTSEKPLLGVSEGGDLLKEGMNKRYMLSICSRSIFNNYFADKPIICSGLIIGTPDKFIEYNDVFTKMD